MPSLFQRIPNARRNGGGPRQNCTPSEPLPGPDFDRQVETLIPAEVRMISGCHALQTSADISNIQSVTTPQGQLPSPAGRSGGACTSALLSILYDPNHKIITFQQLLLELRSRLSKADLSQIPQLSGSRPLDLTDTPFSLVNEQPEFQIHRRAGAGTCRALLVGINYIGQNGQLSGCINDVMNVKKYICEHQGYSEEHVLVLVDNGQHHYPTREKIIRALQQLVAQSVPGDSVYFHYSGHGGLLDPDYWNRFKAGKLHKEYDETLYPVDHGIAGQIRDFSLFNHFVKPMSAGVTVTCVMDCCHSGSVLDLPYAYLPTSAGTIRMRKSMDALTNLAFLYVLAGGTLPYHGGLFDSVTQNLQDVTGESIDNLTGTGVEELMLDTEVFHGEGYGMDDLAFDGTQYDEYNGQDVVDGGGGEYDFGDRDLDQNDYFTVPTENVDYDRRVLGGDVSNAGEGYSGVLGTNYGDSTTAAGPDFDGGGDVDCGDCDAADILSRILEDL